MLLATYFIGKYNDCTTYILRTKITFYQIKPLKIYFNQTNATRNPSDVMSSNLYKTLFFKGLILSLVNVL